MRAKGFSEVTGLDEQIREAMRTSLGGHEPDNFVESALGGAVDGPPNPAAEVEEVALMEELDEQLAAEARTINGEIDYDD